MVKGTIVAMSPFWAYIEQMLTISQRLTPPSELYSVFLPRPHRQADLALLAVYF